uniref:reverse transcriptase domain-containing protein n=1 Tax=Alistipes sp. TaxID=1872444 RepID=UPI004056ED7D
MNKWYIKKICGGLCSSEDPSSPLFSIDDHPDSLPAAGNRNGESLNNAGENGNYWSATPNDSQNAYNLNFNSGNHNVNWNNRNNGHSVRPVSALTMQSDRPARHFSISKSELLKDLYIAYKEARKHKRTRAYQLKFEFDLEENLIALRDELLARTYCPRPSNCFVIHDPKMREVFAANFRDRIVHHLFYNYTYKLFERTFIYDTYSCIKKRGTHFGINRLKHHILSVSAGYSKAAYVLKIDIRGYFMNINRNLLLRICREVLARMKSRESDIKGKTWGELLDYDFVDYLLETIICIDPIQNCHILGKLSDWEKLPKEKSLFFTNPACGLPIGNLSSQLFSNIYLNRFDQFVKRQLGCRHYGRYVDDAYIVGASRSELLSLVAPIRKFLQEELGLTLHLEKTRVEEVRFGIDFLGAYLMPFRTYLTKRSLARIKGRISRITTSERCALEPMINSYLGVMSHYDTYCLRRILLGSNPVLKHCGEFGDAWLTYQIMQRRSIPKIS